MRRKRRFEALEYAVEKPMRDKRPPRTVDTKVYIAGLHDLEYFGSLADGWDEGWRLEWQMA